MNVINLCGLMLFFSMKWQSLWFWEHLRWAWPLKFTVVVPFPSVSFQMPASHSKILSTIGKLLTALILVSMKRVEESITTEHFFRCQHMPEEEFLNIIYVLLYIINNVFSFYMRMRKMLYHPFILVYSLWCTQTKNWKKWYWLLKQFTSQNRHIYAV